MLTHTITGIYSRSTKFNKKTIKEIALTSGDAEKEFSCSIDLRQVPYPTFPLLVLTPNISVVNFLWIQVTGGTAVIRFTQKQPNNVTNYIDMDISASVVFSGVNLSQIAVIGTKVNGLLVTGPTIVGTPPNTTIVQPEIEPVFIEISGMGN